MIPAVYFFLLKVKQIKVMDTKMESRSKDEVK